MENNIILCPHCNNMIIIEALNCGIFRHGIIRLTGESIPPHSEKYICDYFYNNNLIYGCGKPFQVKIIGDQLDVTICDYI
jgi:hypothetical protein